MQEPHYHEDLYVVDYIKSCAWILLHFPSQESGGAGGGGGSGGFA